MGSEITALTVLILMQMVGGLVATAAVGQVVGTQWLLSSRNDEVSYRGSVGGRLDRARSNGFEAIILFAPAVLILTVTGTSTQSTVTAAWVFVGARLVYWLCYAADLVPWRTLVWFAGWLALLWIVVAPML